MQHSLDLTVAIESRPGISLLIQTPCRTTCVVNRRASEISNVLPLEGASRSSMHHCSVIPATKDQQSTVFRQYEDLPNDQIARILPLNTNDILRPRREAHQTPYQLPTVHFRQPFNMMHMRTNIQIPPSTQLMHLADLVSVHVII